MVNDRRAMQRGESRFGGIISLALFLAFCYAVWNVGPVYMANYTLGDKMIEVARLHPGSTSEDRVRDLLMLSVREQGLDAYISKADFKIQVRENRRRIALDYQREAKVLPGWTRTFKFSHDVDQPFF